MTPNQTQAIGHKKYPTWVSKFSTASFYDLPFSKYSTSQVFPLTPILKFQSAPKFYFWQIAKISITLHSPVTALFILKFGSDRIKTLGGVTFYISSPIWPCVKKNFKVPQNLKFLADHPNIHILYSPMTNLFVITFGSDRMKTRGKIVEVQNAQKVIIGHRNSREGDLWEQCLESLAPHGPVLRKI